MKGDADVKMIRLANKSPVIQDAPATALHKFDHKSWLVKRNKKR